MMSAMDIRKAKVGTLAVYLLFWVTAGGTKAYGLAHWRVTQQVIKP